MNSRVDIILKVGTQSFYLDTSGTDAFPLNYNVQDIKDITATKGSYSKSIVVPETPNNRNVFNNITDLNSNSSFDPNLRNRVWVEIDGVVIIEGYFQLTEFQNDRFNHKNGLTLLIFSDNNDFYTIIGEQFLTRNEDATDDIDLSSLDHIWNYSNVTKSWGAYSGSTFTQRDWTWGYYYPLIDYGYGWTWDDLNGKNNIINPVTKQVIKWAGADVGQFRPSVYARVVWDEIFKQAGYTWKSNSLDATGFNDLIIPYNKTTIKRSQADMDKEVFRASSTHTTDLKLTKKTIISFRDINQGPGPGILNQNIYFPNQRPSNWNGGFISNYYQTRVKADNTTTDPNGDPNHLWNTTQYEFTNPYSYDIYVSFGFDLSVRNLNWYSDDFAPYFQLVTNTDPNNGSGQIKIGGSYYGWALNTDQSLTSKMSHTSFADGWTRTEAPTVYGAKDTFTYAGKTYSPWESWTKKFQSPVTRVKPGEKISLLYIYKMNGYMSGQFKVGSSWPYWGYDQVVKNYNEWDFYLNAGTKIATINTGASIWSVPQEESTVNQRISMSGVLPENVKKKDFILSIIKMFNLIVEPSKDEPYTLNIETRDWYYSHGAVKDWTSKIDLRDAIDVRVLGDALQSKRFIFKYTDDEDFYNKTYKNQYNKTFGQFIFTNPNEFVVGDNVMEIAFAPTPISQLSMNNQSMTPGVIYSTPVVPVIETSNNGTIESAAFKMRILSKRAINLDDGFLYVNTGKGYRATSTTSLTIGTGEFTINTDKYLFYHKGDKIDVAYSTTQYMRGTVKSYDATTGIMVFTSTSYGGTGTFTEWSIYLEGTTSIQAGTFSYYPYAGYLDDPTQPTKDFNYGQVDTFFVEPNVTTNTLYHLYWQKQMEEMAHKDSRIVTCSLYLTADDIAKFKFNDAVFLDFGDGGQYYFVNSIIDYDPTNISTTKVELFKAAHITVPAAPLPIPAKPKPKKKNKQWVFNPGSAPWHRNETPGPFNWVQGDDNSAWGTMNWTNGVFNSVGGQNIMTNGPWNSISGNTALVHGAYNFTQDASSSTIMGNNNALQLTSNVTVIGSDNKVVSPPASPVPITNTVVIGTGTTVKESNRVVVASPLVLVNNYVKAGYDEILNPFSENSIINKVDASRNAVRELGSQTNIMWITAGMNGVLENNYQPISANLFPTSW